MSSKRQTTMAKMARERAVREKREKKREKKAAAALEKARAAEQPADEEMLGEPGEVPADDGTESGDTP